MTVHLVSVASGPGRPSGAQLATGTSRAGLVVGKAVGNAVTRHRVSRQLRHLLADRVQALPAGSLLVVRAGATASTADLEGELDAALSRLARAHPSRRGPA